MSKAFGQYWRSLGPVVQRGKDKKYACELQFLLRHLDVSNLGVFAALGKFPKTVAKLDAAGVTPGDQAVCAFTLVSFGCVGQRDVDQLDADGELADVLARAPREVKLALINQEVGVNHLTRAAMEEAGLDSGRLDAVLARGISTMDELEQLSLTDLVALVVDNMRNVAAAVEFYARAHPDFSAVSLDTLRDPVTAAVDALGPALFKPDVTPAVIKTIVNKLLESRCYDFAAVASLDLEAFLHLMADPATAAARHASHYYVRTECVGTVLAAELFAVLHPDVRPSMLLPSAIVPSIVEMNARRGYQAANPTSVTKFVAGAYADGKMYVTDLAEPKSNGIVARATEAHMPAETALMLYAAAHRGAAIRITNTELEACGVPGDNCNAVLAAFAENGLYFLHELGEMSQAETMAASKNHLRPLHARKLVTIAAGALLGPRLDEPQVADAPVPDAPAHEPIPAPVQPQAGDRGVPPVRDAPAPPAPEAHPANANPDGGDGRRGVANNEPDAPPGPPAAGVGQPDLPNAEAAGHAHLAPPAPTAAGPEAPASFFCPITLELMRDPVFTEDGHSYERAAIEQWLRTRNTSPKTGAAMTTQSITPAHALRNAIEEWEASHLMVISRSNLTLEEPEIGGGSFKKVYRGQLAVPGAPQPMRVAVLQMRTGKCDTEARVFLKLGRHPRLVRFFGQCIDGDSQMLVTEYAPRGSVADALEELEDVMTSAHRIAILQQICSGMEALTAAGLVHCDLALRNVLLFGFDAADVSVTSVKVCDFGLTVGTYGRTHRTVAGAELPTRYLPPESLRKRRFSEKSDVWAFGVTAWELLTDGNLPYYQLTTDREVVDFVCGAGLLERPDACSDALWTLLQSCWAPRPTDRPTFAELAVALGQL